MAETVDQGAKHEVYERLHATPEFADLRRRYRSFAFPCTVAFLSWYLLYVVMSNWAHDFMAHQLFGHVNVALVFGLLQFLTTFALARLYARHANRNLDPIAENLREPFERRDRSRGSRRPRPEGGHRMSTQALTTILFLGVVLVTVGITFWASRRTPVRPTSTPAAAPSPASRTARGQRRLHVRRFLPRHLRRSPHGYDGFLYSIGSSSPGSWRSCSSPSCSATRAATRWPTSWPTGCASARPYSGRDLDRRRLDLLPARPDGRRGCAVTLLLGVTSEAREGLAIVGVGLLMIFYVTVGGMKGTTWVQIVKAVLLMGGTC